MRRPTWIEDYPNVLTAQAEHDVLVNFAATVYWPSLGYTVFLENGVYHLVSKNVATGEDDHNAPYTTIYSEIKEAPNGHGYWASPKNDIQYYNPERGLDYKMALKNWGYTWIGSTIIKPEEYYEEKI